MLQALTNFTGVNHALQVVAMLSTSQTPVIAIVSISSDESTEPLPLKK